jgi:hypothetical protein
MKNRVPLEALKSMLQEQAPVRARRDLGVLPGSGAPHPLRAGQIIEVLGDGRWSWCMRLLQGRESSRAAWLSVDQALLFPMALAQEGIALSRILFLERVPALQGLDVLLPVLRSRLFEVVMMDQGLLPRVRQDAQIRKVQLTAEEAGAAVLILSDFPTNSFGVQVRVETGRGNDFRLEKVKGGTGE